MGPLIEIVLNAPVQGFSVTSSASSGIIEFEMGKQFSARHFLPSLSLSREAKNLVLKIEIDSPALNLKIAHLLVAPVSK